ncbi:dihydrofolate reductase family protein [Spirillospora sp. NPDC047279]|uniref:dihydrofolate reductase family protein n=1 Tax=Spirillospora sp. NPDC047279 TaxID=3155478 RepID=UPI003411E21B
MAKVIANMSVSLDGFVADASDGVTEVFTWHTQGDVPIRMPDGSESPSRVSKASSDFLSEMWAGCGALIAGRRTFDLSGGWNGEPPLGLHTFVVSHSIPEGWPRPGTPITFVTEGGVEAAVAQAKAHAGDRIVAVSGADVTQQCLNAGLLDELSIELTPVLLGSGVRYLDKLAGTPVWLEDPRVVEGTGVTHLVYEVRRA